jgi:hypothetical protein
MEVCMPVSREDDREGDGALDSRIDRVLNKYVVVWVWSVLFGTATGAALTFVNYRPSGRYGPAQLFMGALITLGGGFTLLSVGQLCRFLIQVLLPMFNRGESGELDGRATQMLSRAVRYLLAALLLGLIFIAVQYVLGGLAS